MQNMTAAVLFCDVTWLWMQFVCVFSIRCAFYFYSVEIIYFRFGLHNIHLFFRYYNSIQFNSIKQLSILFIHIFAVCIQTSLCRIRFWNRLINKNVHSYIFRFCFPFCARARSTRLLLCCISLFLYICAFCASDQYT